LHSHEEDAGDETVFRPADYRFPPSRGRAGFELKADGGLVELGIGATDRPTESSGTWKLQGKDQLVLESDATGRRTMRIVSLAPNRLVVKK
jgi:hypothetical protein